MNGCLMLHQGLTLYEQPKILNKAHTLSPGHSPKVTSQHNKPRESFLLSFLIKSALIKKIT